jgi:hypothetical protein
MDFYVTLTPQQYNKFKDLSVSLGRAAWNIAVMNAPEDTGNLKRSIMLVNNTSKEIVIRYNLLTANYAQFLEDGVGPVKKYKGFISQNTTADIVEEIIYFAKNGTISDWTLGLKPLVALKKSYNVFNKERQIMKERFGKVKPYITAEQRKQISKLREKSYREAQGLPTSTVRGELPETININKLQNTLLGR